VLKCFKILLLSLTFLLLPIMSAHADILQAPKGKVLLTITGNIKHTNAPGIAQFDREMLEALGMKPLNTKTYWTNGLQRFEGISGKRLMQAVGVRAGQLHVRALDRYKAKIPVADLLHHRATLALKQGGEYLTVATKGPLWLVYPLDNKQKLLKKQITSRSIWQLITIDVL